MTDQNPELFKEAEIVASQPPPPKCSNPFVIAAFWPKGNYWKLIPGLYAVPDGDSLNREKIRLMESGWTNITVIKLPI